MRWGHRYTTLHATLSFDNFLYIFITTVDCISHIVQQGAASHHIVRSTQVLHLHQKQLYTWPRLSARQLDLTAGTNNQKGLLRPALKARLCTLERSITH